MIPGLGFRTLALKKGLAAPVAIDATEVTAVAFSANWNEVDEATFYFLDVSTSDDFSSFVTGYENLNVGNVTTKSVTGLTDDTTYYYRVRAANENFISKDSNIITQATPALIIGGVEGAGIAATGGTESTIDVSGVSYRVHVFNSSSTLDLLPNYSEIVDVEYLVVAGGGGGSRDFGGGGGAGGYRCSVLGELSGGGVATEEKAIVTSNQSIIIGAGGIAGVLGASGTGGNGNDSTVGSIIMSIGGGAGGWPGGSSGNGRNGGSGGGGGAEGSYSGGTGTPNQGYDGGSSIASVSISGGSGGGGASEKGLSNIDWTGGKGGNGLSSSITNISMFRAGGGGGGGGQTAPISDISGGVGGDGGGGNAATPQNSSTAGGVNTGGGGGAGLNRTSRNNGAPGGSGTVIIRYKI